MRLLKYISLLLLAFYANVSFAQNYKFLWGVDNQTVFDNREGDQTYAPQQTIFFTRLSPTVGVQIMGEHKLVAGTHYIQPIGIGYKDNKFIPTAYYSFKHTAQKDSTYRKWTVCFGMIPRRLMSLNGSYGRSTMDNMQRRQLPAILWSDSMDYYNPNIRGILLQCEKRNAFHELTLDWRSLQSAEQREAFNVNYNFEKWFNNPFFFGGNAQLNHLAKRNPAPEGEGVNDDMFLYPYVGADFAKHTAFDQLYLKAGYAVSFDRCRAIGDWEVDGGVLAEFGLLWKKIGIKETLYAGDGQFPLYPMYGSLLNMGDPHYQSKFYSLTSVYSPIVCNEYINFGATLDFHATKEGMPCYQRVVLKVNFGNVDN